MIVLRNMFEDEVNMTSLHDVKYLVVAIELPTGATELIINTTNIPSKIDYYMNAYDENFRLKANPTIQIVDFMLT